MKKKAISALAVCMIMLCCVSFASCNKRCRCMRNNLQYVYYTPEELSQRGKTCSEMIYLEGLAAQYYSECKWEY